MAPAPGRNRANDFRDLTQSNPQDFDPEEDDGQDGFDDSDASSADEEDVDESRAHYEDIGKSKLRKPKTAALGPQYRGSRISRDAALDGEEDDDPFGRGFDEEESDEEDGDGLDDATESSEVEEDENEDGTSDTDMSEDEMSALKTGAISSKEDRAELLKAVSKDQKTVASALAQSTKADAEKGRAVKRQKGAFDSLLNSRIRLQKALVGANTVVGLPDEDLQAQLGQANHALEAAETAAFAFWSSLNDFREKLTGARTGEKRKRNDFGNDTPTEDLWKHMQAQEAAQQPHRNATLNRWAVKARGATALPERGVINRSAQQSSLVDALQEHLSNRDRLLQKAHTPRSCAPLQLANGVTQDDKIYDDADFYGIMLKELLERKSQDSVAASNIDLNFNLKREAKAKKNVDTKASKGRKLRYTVHEKLQNFMAPEDRSTWSERQADELFGSLFGRRLGLGEEREEEEKVTDGAEEKDAGLMLFRR
ncbi:rRNA-processing protein bfr2 [Saxophila tyrrhenica]|uniref:Protein BFR2 n=1 Tax=Saxophila tyrrhenica TaxID=1690608 RepID=A0AAV9P5C3_9PEZI|nr:rRNA-processing protein bfr2 [Saxophila tyrrhenica]